MTALISDAYILPHTHLRTRARLCVHGLLDDLVKGSSGVGVESADFNNPAI
ncbi:hypothetical protein QWZ10_08380 [Paracoccus cavernae]|uniref:Uncharacterized protein n=1 Tax=Paracoccus cavernae TaxID=1571207 RepID=A0ABT8D4X6_9RHOB|nr:hypothetical protein [Paracoccus cavernae]